MAAPTGRESDKFVLRLPNGMRERIRLAAEASSRSMNAEIVAALEEKYPAPKVEIDKSVLGQWAGQIMEISDEKQRARRLEEANQRLSEHPEWSGWKLEMVKIFVDDVTALPTVAIIPPGGIGSSAPGPSFLWPKVLP